MLLLINKIILNKAPKCFASLTLLINNKMEKL